MRHTHFTPLRSAFPWTMGLLILCGSQASGCSDSRLAPAGLKEAHRAALEALPAGDAKGPRVPPEHRPRPRPRPVDRATIPTPPFRLDVRVDPGDLALLPQGAAAVAVLRPDLPALLPTLLGTHARGLQHHPALRWLGPALLTESLAVPLGLRPDRAILVALLAPTGDTARLEKHLQAQVRVGRKPPPGARLRAALAPPRLPETTLRLRIVARVADATRTRAALAALVARGQKAGHQGLRLTSDPKTPPPLKQLATKGVVVVGHGPSATHSWTLAGQRLLLDILLPVSGRWTPTRAARELAGLLAQPPKPGGLSPLERITLLSSADLALVIRAPALARAARRLGVRELLAALPRIAEDKLARMLALGWRVASVPVALQDGAPRAMNGFGLRLYLPGRAQLRLSWQLTALGRQLLDAPTAAVRGLELRHDNGLVEKWLKPVAARVPRSLPPRGPFAAPGLLARLSEGGLLVWPLALAEFWPRLLPVKPVRKAVLKVLRKQIRPGRFVRRINVRQQGNLLELVLEGTRPTPMTAQ